ncbi:hypothetical protein KSP40_PGU017914 [Platanthera guangdongensis]|uniref:Bulb-type lectin domain-containing protein n=1 Tax=Platanthera guangdongensis TaxID=2320717 RepID=A0ABR2MEA8_9ASPA
MLGDSTSLPSTLYSGQALTTNKSLQAGNLFLTVQSDCNLVAYSNRRPNKVAIWATNTNGQGRNCVLVLLKTCELILLSNTPRTVWSTMKTSKNGSTQRFLYRATTNNFLHSYFYPATAIPMTSSHGSILRQNCFSLIKIFLEKVFFFSL